MKLFCTPKKFTALFKKSMMILGLFWFVTGKINAQTYVNGNLSTGATASTGEASPNCATWSEVQTGNTTAGYSASLLDGFTVADDFTVPAGASWNLTKFTCYAYSTGYTGSLSAFNDVRLQIYNTDPSVGAPAPIYGDLTTNRLITSYFSKIYRIFDGAPDQGRKVWQIEAAISITLAPGTYWVEWQVGTSEAANWTPTSTVAGTVTQPGNNAMQHNLTLDTWVAVLDGNNPPTDAPNAQDIPFMIDYNTASCTGTPAPGNTIYTDINGCIVATPVVCPGTPFLLSAQNATAGSGVSYQWQSSIDGLTYTDIAGATNNVYLTSLGTTALYYRVRVTCSGSPSTSIPIIVGLTPAGQCYCIPTPTDCTDGDIITNVTLGTLNNTSDCGIDGFTDYTTDPSVTIPDLIQGVPNAISVTAGGGTFTETVAVWIDYDHSGSFDASEFTFIGTTTGGVLNGNINVPATAPPGPARMRVRVEFFDPLTEGDACLLYTYGETEDYTVNIVGCITAAITTQPLPATTTCGGDTSFTVAGTGNLLTYQWQQRITTVAPWTDVVNGAGFSGATTATLHVSGVTGAMNGYEYRAIVTSACGAGVNSNPALLTVNILAVAVSPTSVDVCLPVGALLPLSITTLNSVNTTQTTSYTSGTLNLAIPDLNDAVGVTNTINVPALPAGAVITGASVTLNVAHTFVSDLIIALKAPNGNILNLDYNFNAMGGVISTGFVNTEIGSTGTATLDSGTDPFTGLFAPDAYPTAFPGFPTAPTSLSPTDANVFTYADLYAIPSGNWTLGIYDFSTPDAGTLNNWTLTLTYNVVSNAPYTGVWSPATGLFNDAAGTSPYVAGTAQTTVYLQPTTTTTYSVTPVTTGCAGAVVTIPVNVSSAVDGVTAPANSTICENSNTSFAVTTTAGTGIVYVWQVSTDGGAIYTNVADGGVYSNATTQTLTLANVPLSYNGYKYRAILTAAACSGAVTTDPATLTVTPGGATITFQPSSSTVCEGEDNTFSVTATGTGLLYQWQVSPTGCAGTFSDIPGANADSYTITGATGIQNGYAYVCVITGACSPLISACATLSVNTATTIVTQPADVLACEGGVATFISLGGGTSVAYQWQVNTGSGFTDIAGETNATLTISPVTAALNNYQYQVIISNTSCGGAVISNPVTLTVTTSPGISTQPADVVACNNADAVFTVVSSSTGVTYQWQVNTGTGFTDIAGETNATLTITGVAPANSGNQYQVILSIAGCTGATTSAAVTLTVNEQPSISTQPTDASICEGNIASFTTTASGTNITYQWQLSTDNGTSFSDITGATAATFSTAAVTATMNGYLYQVIVSGTCTPAVTSIAALLTVNAISAITTQPLDVSSCAGTDVTFTVAATGGSLTYQWQVSTTGCGGTFTDITGETNAGLSLTAITAAQNNNAYQCVVTGTCGATITSNCATLTVGTLDITAQPTDQALCAGSAATFTVTATGTAITYQWQVSVASGPFTDTPGATTNTLSIAAVTVSDNGNQYVVLVSNTLCPTVTSTPATLSVTGPVSITTQPENVSICENADATFTVTTTGGTGTLFQWQVSTDGGATFTDIAGETTTTLTLTAVTSATNNNVYHVVVTNPSCASVITSGDGILTVNPLPAVTITANPVNTSLLPGQSTVLTATVTPTGTYDYSWTRDGAAVAGATSASLTVNNGEAGLYAATASGTGGICAGTSNTIEVRDSVTTGFNIYPNPNNGQFTVVYPGLPARSTVGVFDSHGSRVSVKTDIDANQVIHVDMRPFSSGVYIIVVYNGAGERLMTGKVIVVE